MDLRAKFEEIDAGDDQSGAYGTLPGGGLSAPRSQPQSTGGRTLNARGARIDGYGNSLLGAQSSAVRPRTVAPSQSSMRVDKPTLSREQLNTGRRLGGITPPKSR